MKFYASARFGLGTLAQTLPCFIYWNQVLHQDIFDNVVLKMSIPFVIRWKVMANMQSFLLLICLNQLTTFRVTSTTQDEETV